MTQMKLRVYVHLLTKHSPCLSSVAVIRAIHLRAHVQRPQKRCCPTFEHWLCQSTLSVCGYYTKRPLVQKADSFHRPLDTWPPLC